MSRQHTNIILMLVFMCWACDARRIRHKKSNETFEGKIVGGLPVNIEELPFAVQFVNSGGLCGGVILNSWTVITSAHCFDMNTDTQEMGVLVGTRYAYDINGDKHRVLTFVIHEDYNKAQIFSCDIAMIFLEKPIKLGVKAMKGLLVDQGNWMNEKETNFTVMGWGWTQYDGEISKVGLQMAQLSYVSSRRCSQLHDGYLLTKDMFCLYGEGKSDTCKGDSGGGVLWQGLLVGLTSHGNGCANKDRPSVYTNLWILRPWIKKQMNYFIKNYCKIPQLAKKLPVRLQ